MSLDLQLVTIPIATVAKVLLVAFVGGTAGRYFSHPSVSAKGISTMTVKIFLPAMLFSRMASDMNMDLLRGGYGWAMVLCFVPLCVGHLSALFLKRFIADEGFHALFLLANTFHNVVSFGLGVTQSLAGPLWINAAAYAEFATVVFLWNLPHSLLCFGWGTMMVRHGKAEELRSAYAKELLDYEAEVARRQRLLMSSAEGNINTEEGPCAFSSTDANLKPNKAEEIHAASGGEECHSTTPALPILYRPLPERTMSPRHSELAGAKEEGKEEVNLPSNALPPMPIPDVCTAHISDKGDSCAPPMGTPTSPNGSAGKWRRHRRLIPIDSDVGPSSSIMTATSASALLSVGGRPTSPTTIPPTPAEASALPPLVAPSQPALPAAPETGLAFVKALLVETLTNITNAASLTGMAIGLVPALRWALTVNSFGRIFVDATAAIGGANVPLTLLQLGTNLTSAQKAPNKRMVKVKQMVPIEDVNPSSSSPHKGAMVEREVEVEAPSRGVVLDYVDSLEVPLLFILLTALIRLVIVPSTFLVVFFALKRLGDIPILGPIPSSKAFQLTVLIESCGPTAINTNNLCAMFNYRTAAYSQALLGIYVLSIATTAVWLSLYLWILND